MIRLIVFAVFITLVSPRAWCVDDWYTTGSAHLLNRVYSDSAYYSGLIGLGVSTNFDYLDKTSWTIGGNYNYKRYQTGLSSAPSDMNEFIGFAGLAMNKYLDSYPGKITYRVDVYLGRDQYNGITMNSSGPGSMGGGSRQVSISDNFYVISTLVSYLNNSKTFYLDLGLALSSYQSDSTDLNIDIAHPNRNNLSTSSAADDIRVTQWTPTMGWGFHNAMDWVQVRPYFLRYSSSNRVAYRKSSAAVQLQWLHWFSYDALLGLNRVNLSLVGGQRIYAVDNDSYSLYNTPDLQRTSLSLGAKWKLDEDSSIDLHAGMETYLDLVDNEDYKSQFVFVQLSQNWQ